MSNKACKLKLCICAAAAEAKALETNFEAAFGAIADLGAGNIELDDAGIDTVIAAADASVAKLRKLNEQLVNMGVGLASAP